MDAAAIAQRLTAGEEAALAQKNASGTATAAALAEVLDSLVAEHAAEIHQSHPVAVAIVVLGGQGRQERCPKSDVDFVILHDGGKAVSAFADAFLYPLWDARLELGHGVRTISESIRLAQSDDAALTALLDARLLFGKQKLFEDLQRGCTKLFAESGPAYVQRVLAPIRSRASAESDVFVLEPDFKNGPGGLRDLQTLRFVANFRWQARDFAALHDKQMIDSAELAALYAARNFLLQARIRLHHLAKRKQDRLNFEYHTELGALFYPHAENPIEPLLSRHYRHARAVVDIMHRIVVRAEEKKATAHAPDRQRAGIFPRRHRARRR